MLSKTPLYNLIIMKKKVGQKQLAVLIDPDKLTKAGVLRTVDAAIQCSVDLVFVGGSLLMTPEFESTISFIKKSTDIPVILFPGSPLQISSKADGILLLSLISGRNPEMLIGQHVVAAPYLRASGIEILSTGYMLIDSGKQTTASYMSNSLPIPANKDDIASCTALAGEMLGLKLIYLDAGSGAEHPVSISMIKMVRKTVSTPLIVGGGIKSPEDAYASCMAGADVIVIGNAFEKELSRMKSIAQRIHGI